MGKTVCNKPELLQKQMEHLRKVLTHCKYPRWALDRVEKRLTKPTSEISNVANSQGTTGTQPNYSNDIKMKGHIVIPYSQGLCKASERSAVGMVYRPTSKVTAPLKTYWSSPGTKTQWQTKWGHLLVPIWVPYMWWWVHREPLGPLEKDSKST